MAVCRTCAAELPGGARFCPACGAPVSARGGEERKVVTVLFADLVDSTSQADRRDPEDVRAAVRPQLMRIREELERHGGTFEKYVGDAVMAVFGAPVAHEDDPERAVRAALAIRDAIEGVRVAVNTGEAVVTLSAASGAGEGIATGDVVNTTFRIEEAAGNGTVLVGEPTYRVTQATIEYGARRLLQAKGKADPVPVYEALRAPSELHPSPPTPPLAPFVGRHHELSLVIDTLARAKRDRTVQLVTLMGVPGIGKSRLVWELQRALAAESGLVTWRRGRCLPYGDGVTYWALGEMVKAQAGVLASDDAGTALAKLSRSVRELVVDPAEADWVESHLRPLLTLEAAPSGRRDEAFAAWRRLFEALAEWGPLVLVFEDLHWADEGLLDFIDHLADWGTGMPLVLLCTARPGLHERRAGWGGRPNAATILLPPLSRDETAQLVGFLLKQSRVPPELQRAMLARSEGNPLYAEEFVRMLVERALLYRDGGDWQLRDGDLPVPASVQAIIAARLDALPLEEKEVLRDAAVVGRRFWPGAVSAVSGAERSEVEKLLRRLERKELVRRVATSAIADELQYSFHHALGRDGAYGVIPRAERARKHCLAAEWIESLARAEDHSETIAHHYLKAVEYARAAQADFSSFAERARRALRGAGERALALNAFPKAALYFLGALELEPDDRERADLMFLYTKAGYVAGTVAETDLVTARDELLRVGDPERAAEVESELGFLASARGDGDASLAHRRRAVELVAKRPPSPSKAFVHANLAAHLVHQGQADEAATAARSALEMATALGLDNERARALRTLGIARLAHGESDGINDLVQSVEIAAATASGEQAASLANLAGAYIYVGDLRSSFELHERIRDVADRFGDAVIAQFLESEGVARDYWLGQWDDAIASAKAILTNVESGQPSYFEAPVRIFRGHIRLARDDVAGALDDAGRALAAGRLAGDKQLLHPALAFGARVCLDAGRNDDAAAAASELLVLMEPLDVVMAWQAWSDLAIVLRELSRGGELIDLIGRATARTAWTDAACAYAGGDFVAASEIYGRMGALPEQAFARLSSARFDHVELGSAFFRSVGGRRVLERVPAQRRLKRGSRAGRGV